MNAKYRHPLLLVGLVAASVSVAGGLLDQNAQDASGQYMSGGRQFGPFTAPNITPDAHGRPAGLSFEEFKQVFRTGMDPDGSGRLLQVMPWPIYGNMTDGDLRAVYEYLRAIPSLADNPTPGP